MTFVLFIRTKIGLTQKQFAAAIGACQSTVSRWDNGDHTPNLDDVKAIRSLVRRKRMEWDDSWILNPPKAGARHD